MDEEKILSAITDANVEKLDRVNKALRSMLPAQREMVRQRQGGASEGPRPGTRQDGGMAATIHDSIIKELVNQILKHEGTLQGNLADAHSLVDKFEAEQLRLEDEIRLLKAALEEETRKRIAFENRCEELKGILRSAADIMVNGERSKA